MARQNQKETVSTQPVQLVAPDKATANRYVRLVRRIDGKEPKEPQIAVLGGKKAYLIEASRFGYEVYCAALRLVDQGHRLTDIDDQAIGRQLKRMRPNRDAA